MADTPAFTVQAEFRGGTAQVIVRGDLDIGTSPQLDQMLTLALGKKPDRLVVDLAGVHYLDCSAARVITRAASQLPPGHLALRRPSQAARRLLQLTSTAGLIDASQPAAPARHSGSRPASSTGPAILPQLPRPRAKDSASGPHARAGARPCAGPQPGRQPMTGETTIQASGHDQDVTVAVPQQAIPPATPGTPWPAGPAGQPVTGPHPRDWPAAAACRHTDPGLFFPVSRAGPSAAQITAAKAICARYPVCRPCLAFALDHSQAEGTWGATTSPERQALRPAPATPAAPLLPRQHQRART